MPKTEVRSKQIKDGEVKRSDLNITESTEAVIAKIIAGNGINISSTGVDAGTGDVTINSELPILDNNSYLQWRNQADTTDLNILKVDTSDNTVLNAITSKKISLQINEAEIISIDADGLKAVGDNTEDIGDTTNNFSTLHSRNIRSNNTLNLYSDLVSGQAIKFYVNNSLKLSFTEGGDDFISSGGDNTVHLGWFGNKWISVHTGTLLANNIFSNSGASFLNIYSNQTNGYVSLAGRNSTISQSSVIETYSATHASLPGDIRVRTPTLIDADVTVQLNGTSGSRFVVNDGSSDKLEITQSGHIFTYHTSAIFGAGTTDGSDNARVSFCGGGSDSSTRGSYIRTSGNEHADTGDLLLAAGASVGEIIFSTNSSSRWGIGSDGLLFPFTNGTVSIGGTTNHVDKIFCTEIGSGSASFNLDVLLNNTAAWRFQVSGGHFLPLTNGVYDIGTSGTAIESLYYTGSLNDTSDIRLKENIVNIDDSNALTKINSLQPICFNYKSAYVPNQSMKCGFSAQEVYNEIPEAVKQGDSNLSLEYGDVGFETWHLDSTKLVPYLVGAIKRLKQMCDDYETRINILEGL